MRLAWLVLGLTACFDTPEFACDSDAACIRDGDQGRCELAGYCSFADDSCDGGRRFAEASAELSNVCLTIESPCLLPTTAVEAWRLQIPTVGPFLTQEDIPYEIDRRSELAGTVFSRVAYCLLLDDVFVYTELDDFTSGNAADTGVPTDVIFDEAIGNLTVRTNSPVVTPGTGGLGAIEMWPNCYSPGANDVYDTDDDITNGDAPDACYGSFQVHREQDVIWAFNRWTNDDATNTGLDLGIGNNPGDGDPDHPDWTFERNASDYTTRTLQAFIIP